MPMPSAWASSRKRKAVGMSRRSGHSMGTQPWGQGRVHWYVPAQAGEVGGRGGGSGHEGTREPGWRFCSPRVWHAFAAPAAAEGTASVVKAAKAWHPTEVWTKSS